MTFVGIEDPDLGPGVLHIRQDGLHRYGGRHHSPEYKPFFNAQSDNIFNHLYIT